MAHLAKVPDYLLPASLRTQVMQSKREAKRRARDSLPVNAKRRKKEAADPLKTFQPPKKEEKQEGREERLKAKYERKRLESQKRKRDKLGQGAGLSRKRRGKGN
eukprot:379820-Hanusia_phi.AAC.1